MKRSILALGALASAVLLVATTASPARADHLPGFDAVNQNCRNSIAKVFGKTVKAATKVSASCHKSRNAGKVAASTDCNDLSASQADSKGKFQKAQAKLTAAIDSSCTAAGADRKVLDEYVSCPEPCNTEVGLLNPLTSFADLGKCLACVAGDVVENAHGTTLGSPSALPLGAAEQSCHKAIAKFYDKLLGTILKDRSKCQKAEDTSGNTALQPCDTSDSKGKIQKAADKASAGVQSSCAAANLPDVSSCATTDVTALNTCLKTTTEDAGKIAFTESYELEATVCPISVDAKLMAGYNQGGLLEPSCSPNWSCKTNADCTYGVSQCDTVTKQCVGTREECVAEHGYQSRTFLEIGWQGYAQEADVPDNYYLSSALSCPGTTPPACGDCTVTGVAPNGPQSAAFLRCEGEWQTRCTTPFGQDDACTGGLGTGNCVYVLGPPLALSSGNTPTCSINALADDITGTVNPDTGSSELHILLRARTYSGNLITLPCPVCVGDTTAGDGVQGGKCSGGVNNGNKCDVDAYDATFAPQKGLCDTSQSPAVCFGPSPVGPGEKFECTTDAECTMGLSLDCPPTTGSNITGNGLPIPFHFTTGHTALPFGTKCDAPLGSRDCACAVCTLNQQQPCNANADCDTRGICTALGNCAYDPLTSCTTDADCAIQSGTCTAKGSGESRKPNGCAPGETCIPVGDDKGQCTDDISLNRFCDGLVRASGKGYVACNGDGDCIGTECNPATAAADACGLCTIEQPKPCFLNPIVDDGVADTENPLLVSTFCLPPTSNAGVNNTAGLPGPARVAADMLTHLVYY